MASKGVHGEREVSRYLRKLRELMPILRSEYKLT